MDRYGKHVTASCSEIMNLNYIAFKIASDLTDVELDVKWQCCNDLLSVLDTLNCGDCKKRGNLFFSGNQTLRFLFIKR